MDRSTRENSIPVSSNVPLSTTRIASTADEENDIDTDGIIRNPDGGRHDIDQPRRQPIRSCPRRHMIRWLIALLLLSCIIYVIVDFCGDRKIETTLSKFLEWVHIHPYRGAIAVILCYIIATVFFVPGSILTFGAGFAIGSAVDNTAMGVLLATGSVFIGASIGSICSFLLGRYLFRDCVLQLAFSYPTFQAIELALESNGLKIMVLLRLSPLIPFNALDYISGVTSISLRDYTIALVAILPGALMLCFFGASASSLSDRTSSTSSNTVKIVTIVSGILFGGCGVYMASYYSKLELDRILANQSTNSTEYISTLSEHVETDETIEMNNDDEEGYSAELVRDSHSTS